MIRHYKIFLFLGFVIFILPFLGIPQVWKSTILFIFGGILIIISLLYRHILRSQDNNEDEVYVDSVQEIREEIYINDKETNDAVLFTKDNIEYKKEFKHNERGEYNKNDETEETEETDETEETEDLVEVKSEKSNADEIISFLVEEDQVGIVKPPTRVRKKINKKIVKNKPLDKKPKKRGRPKKVKDI